VTTLLLPPAVLDGVVATVTGEAYHHLFRVRRLAVGEDVRVVDGEGRARRATVATVDRSSGRLDLGAELPSAEAALQVHLMVAALKPDRAAWLVEKVTELGVVGIHFLSSERTPRNYGDGSLERLRRVAAGAVEQCGRARLPEVSGVHPWSELPTLLAPLPRRLVLDIVPAGAARPAADAGGAIAVATAVLIGPEGGWSEPERVALATLGAEPWHLGDRVLRVETAAVVASALLLASPVPRRPPVVGESGP
jgi:16S rRNA (uracil1498-N3)-methyltransferase